MKSVFVGLPCNRSIRPESVASLLGLVHQGHDLIADIQAVIYLYIDRARNMLADDVLDRPDVTHLLALDDDHLWPGDLVARLLAHRKPIVGATYFTRRPPHHLVAGVFHGDRIAHGVPEPGLHRVQWLGMGATLVETRVFRDMRERYKDKKWFRSEEDGEEIHFFRRVLEMDVPVYLDGDCVCGHMADEVIGPEHWKAYHQEIVP